jgi:hypothetical protein
MPLLVGTLQIFLLRQAEQVLCMAEPAESAVVVMVVSVVVAVLFHGTLPAVVAVDFLVVEEVATPAHINQAVVAVHTIMEHTNQIQQE